MRKKLIMSLLMAIILAFVTIFVPVKTVRAEGNVCRIVRVNDENPSSGIYDTISKAFNSAYLQNGDTIEMIGDFTASSTQVAVSKQVTLDLNGHNITFTANGGGFVFEAGSSYDEVHSTLTIRATNGGSIIKSGGQLIRFKNEGSGGVIYNHLTIESGNFECFNLYTDQPDVTYLSSEYEVFENLVTINGGTFTALTSATRDNLRALIADDTCLISSVDLPSSPQYKLELKPFSYITSEDTKASAKISYTEGYACYRRVDTLSVSDAGKKYLVAYVNKSEDKIYIMKNYENVSYHAMYTDKHDNVNATNDGTWYINSNTEFIGTPDENFFVTLGWAGNGYTLSVSDRLGSKYLFFNNSQGSQFSPKEDSYMSDESYIYKFNYNDAEDYLFPLAVSKCIVYSNMGDYAGFFKVAGTGKSYESGIGDRENLYAHLFEKVDVDPVVSDASLRFGQTISKEMYDYLSGCGTTVTFGVIAKLTSALGGEELEYANAQIKKAITPVRVSAAGATEEDLEGDFYQFALVLSGITSSNYDTSVTARCYVCIDGTYYYYFNPSVYSVKTLANAYYNADDTSSYEEHLPVLKYLKDYGD